MGKKFTLIELHLDGDAQLGPKTINDALPFGKGVESEDAASEDDDEAAADDDSSGKGAIGVLVGLALLVGIGVALKKFRGDDAEEETYEQRDEPDVIVN
ncbi:hypothetical protein HALLA_12975 [Halostagnicola larsenii XH-48]|uniref:Uncharacterized protein n=1 Tax=Halostagnicola larsenii XH-48 TaxID=797299 RepID=W0JLE4_9EURY|nr:hypothetical protein [Halostagnicola larsenii]AHF99565.1 hypothetical protein HALLA_12975 [Halostagnicola larsenii XH-48]